MQQGTVLSPNEETEYLGTRGGRLVKLTGPQTSSVLLIRFSAQVRGVSETAQGDRTRKSVQT